MPTYLFTFVVESGTADPGPPPQGGATSAASLPVERSIRLERNAPSFVAAVLEALAEHADTSNSTPVLRVEHDGVAALEDVAARIELSVEELREMGVDRLPTEPLPPDGRADAERWYLWDVAHWLGDSGDRTLLDILARERAAAEAINLGLAMQRVNAEIGTRDRELLQRWLISSPNDPEPPAD